MATSENSRSKLGSKREVAPGKWVIRVQAGFRADGHVRRVSRTVYGTETEADIAIAQLARELGVSQAAHAGVTLDMYYWGVFRDSPSNRGKPRSRASLREYDGQMCNYISPVLGGIDISEITHDMMRSCIERSGAPAKTKTTLRAVMRRAFDDGWVSTEPFRRRVIAPKAKQAPVEPWSIPEAAEALRRLAASDDRADLVMNAYLILGLSGLRKEEALAVRPCDLKVTTTYDFATGQPTVSEYIEVCRAYTDEDGIKETKNDHSVRTVPVLMAGRGRLHQIMDELRPSITVEGGTSVTERAAHREHARRQPRARVAAHVRTPRPAVYPAKGPAPHVRDHHGGKRHRPAEHHGPSRPYGPGDRLPPLHQTGPRGAREGRQAGRARPADRRGRRRGRRF